MAGRIDELLLQRIADSHGIPDLRRPQSLQRRNKIAL
jgi:hypothetical protein